ncbi:pilus assembly protein TadG-related protein [Paraburkholderia sp. MMS20-SJTR3]|uniref:Pilus assembly protein TadG-related protein n=1 Tax=Paraburkholderia sejongensis TaxID=2886946 RepID=A0ABS8JTC5_9BURK|nr:TadG family pilus assembly protein [Paraburkholderia sp. MMS20-SJTR3]MCC8392979.1 pilus assembly protein TadG-related protein [Paraburkholderia sp. MMS20-SJTR3]
MRTRSKKRQQGAVAVMVALMLIVLLGIGALAVDIGNLMVARNELQNAADAAAMAGAGCLKPRSECSNASATQPDWTTASTTASTFSTSSTTNKVQGAYLKASTVATGYWNATGSPYGLEALPFTPGSNDMPAVQVTIRKDGSNANGSVSTFLGKVFGVQVLKASAVATAVLASPGSVGPGGLFPMAMSKCLFDTYWSSTTNSPKLSPTSGLVSGGGSTVPQVAGQPYYFQIGSAYQYGACQSGQWTTFDSSDNSASYARGLITNGNSTTFSIGSSPGTWIQTGEKNSLFNDVYDCSAAGNGQCAWETVAVVADPSTSGFQPVLAFACVHILNASNGSNPYVLVQMSNDMSHCETPNSGGAGPSYGAYTPPRLVQ